MKLVSLKKNFIMNTILTMSSFVFPLITFPYVTRILLPAGTGRVAFAISLISYFNVFAQLGVPTYGVRACAQVRDNKEELTKTAQELIIINLIMSGLAYISLAAGLIFIPRLYTDRTLYIIVSVTIFLNAIGMEWLYKALEKYTYITIRSMLFKIVALASMFMLVHTEADYVVYGGISVFAASASNITNFIHSRKYIDWKLVGNYDFKKHLKPIWTFFAMACATTIYTNLDELMLGFMAGDIEVGYYDAATKIKKVLVGVVTSLGVVVLPRAAYYQEKGMRIEFWAISKKTLHFTVLMAAPITVFFMIFVFFLVFILAGKAYNGAVIPMQIIMPTILFIGLTNIMGLQIMVPLNREKQVLHSVILGAIVDAILNCIFIPPMGASGAAIGTLLAEITVLIYQFVALKKNILEAYKSVRYWKIVLAISVASTVSMMAQKYMISEIGAVIIGGLTFFILYGATLLLTKEELTTNIMQNSRMHQILRNR